MPSHRAALSGTDAEEPLLQENNERFCMYPIRCLSWVHTIASARMTGWVNREAHADDGCRDPHIQVS